MIVAGAFSLVEIDNSVVPMLKTQYQDGPPMQQAKVCYIGAYNVSLRLHSQTYKRFLSIRRKLSTCVLSYSAMN